MLFPSFKEELKYLKQGYELIIGCDEAGRGPVAGPVVAAACILDPKNIGGRGKDKWYARVRDSKTISEREREILAKKIKKNALVCSVGIVSEREIEKLNIHNASLLAMHKAISKIISQTPRGKRLFVLIDGKFKISNLRTPQQAIINGDALSLSISAASIIAKTHRDAIMRELDKKFPKYGFAKHKGYYTKEHQKALRKWGRSPVHRKSFIKQG
mgnify:CR=1 FL=1